MWGIKYENGDISFNEKVEDNAFSMQGLEIWKNIETNEYRGGYGMDKAFFSLSEEGCYKAVINKISAEVWNAKKAKFIFSGFEEGKLNIEINFTYEN